MNIEKQKIDEKDRKRAGIIITICVHLSFIACFILFGFKVVDPKKGTTELTWEIEGVTNAGGESQNTPTSEAPSTDQENQQTAATSSQASDDEKLISDESSEVAINSSPVKTKKAPTEVTNTKQEETADTKAEESPSNDLKNMMANYNKGKNSKAGSSGLGNKEGKEGNENTHGKDASGDKGAGNGKYDITGRIATKLGTQKNDCGESGTVEIKIIVNQAGVVIEAIHVDGTTSNKCLINQAKAYAKQIKYAPSKVGESKTNEGRITIKGSLN
jgi:hypothetical protein